MSLHVLQLGPYPPPEGGISRNMLAIRQRLLEKGHRCSIVATSRSSRVVNETDIYHPNSAFELIDLIRRLKADVIHLHVGGNVTPRVLSLMFAVGLLGRRRSVLTLHSGGYPDTASGRAAKPLSLRGAIFNQFERLLAVNPRIANVFERYGVPPGKVKVILPYSLAEPDESVKVPSALAEFCVRHSPLLLAVGGLEHDYDPLFLVKAMQPVKERYAKAGLIIVGGGSMKEVTENAVAASGLRDSILLAGDVEHAVTLQLMKTADVMLRTTLFDGDAISVREALFVGTPVIATDNGMRPEGVALIKERTPEELLTAIDHCLSLGRAPASKGTDLTNIDEILRVYNDLSRSQ